MSKARQLADLLDSNGDVVVGALDNAPDPDLTPYVQSTALFDEGGDVKADLLGNVPPSNDASALTTGTLPIARIADGAVTAAKIGSLPSGTIIQAVGTSGIADGHEAVGNSTTFTSSRNNINIVCQGGTSSKFLITVYQGGSHCQAGTAGQSWLERAVGASDTQINYSASGGSALHIIRDPGESGNNYYPISQIYVDSPSVSAGTTITYRGRYKRNFGSNSFYYLHYGFGYGIHVLEIAG